MTKHYGRRALVALGVKLPKGYDEMLAQLTPEELTILHKEQSFKIGGATTGVVYNAIFTCVSPPNAVGTVVNSLQLRVAIRGRRMIEEAAKAHHDRDLREGSDRASMKRHIAAGAITKVLWTFTFQSQDDFHAAMSTGLDMDLASPETPLETVIGVASNNFYNTPFVEDLHDLSDHLSAGNCAVKLLGFEQNPTWSQLCQGGSMTSAAGAVIGIGVANEANLATLAADAAGERLHRQYLQGGNRRAPETAPPQYASYYGQYDSQYYR